MLGRRRVLMAGLAVFTAASLGCGLSDIGAAIVLPAALSIVMNIFPEGRRSARSSSTGPSRPWIASPYSPRRTGNSTRDRSGNRNLTRVHTWAIIPPSVKYRARRADAQLA